MNTLIKPNYNRHIKSVLAIAMTLFILLALAIPIFAQQPSNYRNDNLQISASWSEGDILILNIIDSHTVESQQVAIRLSDFVYESENVPYFILQAQDFFGKRQSGVIHVPNPLFTPYALKSGQTISDSGSALEIDELPDHLQEVIAAVNANEPSPALTPDGTGTVTDNIMTINDIEFFTISTHDGNDFFLVIDRQRTSNNVYLLNTVTESDLMTLAESVNNNLPMSSVAAVQPPTEAPPTVEDILQALQESTAQNTTPVPTQQGAGSGIIIVMLIAMLAGGGLIFWKKGWPKLQALLRQREETYNHDGDGYYEIDEGNNDDREFDYGAVIASEETGATFQGGDDYGQ